MLVAVDDMDVFKGIELKLMAFERLLDQHPEYRGKLVLVQVGRRYRGGTWGGAGLGGTWAVHGEVHGAVLEVQGQAGAGAGGLGREGGRVGDTGAGGRGAHGWVGGGGGGAWVQGKTVADAGGWGRWRWVACSWCRCR